MQLKKKQNMLTIAQIEAEQAAGLGRLRKRNWPNQNIISEILELDAERRRLQQQHDDVAATLNKSAKTIGALMAKGERQAAEAAKAEVAALKAQQKAYAEQLASQEQKLYEELVQIPNLPHPSVPAGKTAADNEVLRSGGDMPRLAADAVPHWELAARYRLIDWELGNKITGAGFPVYIGAGARLQRALIQFFLNENTAAGFTEYQVPIMVNTDSAYGTGQLPDKEGQMYHTAADDYYMIPTAEVPLTNIWRGDIIAESELPIRMTGYTPCFRREAGSYGKDVRGLNRLHQFDKVEVVALTKPEDSYAMLDRMVDIVEQLLIKLGLPYRILRLCGGDMGFTSALTYDFEVWSAAQERWLEVSSVSCFESFQTNRMKIRYKDEGGKTQLLHSLNGSALALPRIVACLLENNQHANGISLPECLAPWMDVEIK